MNKVQCRNKAIKHKKILSNKDQHVHKIKRMRTIIYIKLKHIVIKIKSLLYQVHTKYFPSYKINCRIEKRCKRTDMYFHPMQKL